MNVWYCCGINLIKMKNILVFISLVILSGNIYAQKVTSGATQMTPSNSEFFSWINNTNEGATTRQTLINLNFFHWLNKEYGMKLDIYAFDAGAIDGANRYGSMKSERFNKQFPGGFAPIAKKAAENDTRLGIWGGPDGFGNTEKEAELRIEQTVSLCRDYHFKLFKMDGVCGPLRPEKYDYFDQMMTRCREYAPDLILLNHRLELGPGTKHSTTFLLGGAETYVDVHIYNELTASHHRAGALSRELPENLNRLTEDHGVCLSSCLDYWEDDLILQAFNRALIVSPQIYGNPWLLRDDEFPKLAFIFNLQRKYRDILVNGMVLPGQQYGVNAVSRGDGKTRLLTLRNLTWKPITYRISLDKSIGLDVNSRLKVTQYHPYIQSMGEFAFGSFTDVEVLPFRSCLIKVSAMNDDDFELTGIPYEIVRNVPDKPVEIKMLGMPGRSYTCSFNTNKTKYGKAEIDGGKTSLLNGHATKITFDGIPLKESFHRQIAEMKVCSIPEDAESIYYATCFAADNNALEVRSLLRSGETKIPEVKEAREAFFTHRVFREREIWDKNLFDGDEQTAFSVNLRSGDQRMEGKSGFLLDMGKAQHLDKLVIKSFDEYSITPLKSEEGLYVFFSNDLKNWEMLTCETGKVMQMDTRDIERFRYIRFAPCPMRITEVEGFADGKMVDRTAWRANNLFRSYQVNNFKAQKCWSATFILNEIPKNAYLCVAINGQHGIEGAFAGFKMDGEYIGCPDRSPSFAANVWEERVRKSDENYTYYLPISPEMKGKTIEAYVLGFDGNQCNLKPEIYLSTYPIPFEEKKLILHKN